MYVGSTKLKDISSIRYDGPRHDHTFLNRKVASDCTRNSQALPSPPMSNPPSPTRQSSNTASDSPRASASRPAVIVTEPTHGIIGTAPWSSPFTSRYTPRTSLFGTTTAEPSATLYSAASYPPPIDAVTSTLTSAPATHGPLTTTTAAAVSSAAVDTIDSTTAKPGRKSKSHVASACVNCKKAHLSCDIQRPCARCVASSKQDTCYDVQHKKRGRPRLREEGDARTEQVAPSSSSQQPSTASGWQQTPSRPIAKTRAARAESFRSHQSRGSEGSSYGQITPASATFPAFSTALTYGPGSGAFNVEIPTAILDLDLVIVKANRFFRQIMAGGRALVGTRLADVAAPADGEQFLNIRNRLRAEREQREPSYLPPIVQSGQDPLENIRDSDLDRLTHGYADITYYWVALPAGPDSQHFPARVRLAKASTYFAVITLPSFRSTMQSPIAPPRIPQPSASFLAGSPLPHPESYPGPRTNIAHPPPPSYSHPYGSSVPPPQPHPFVTSPSSRPFPPGPVAPYQQSPYPPYQYVPAPYPGRATASQPPPETFQYPPMAVPPSYHAPGPQALSNVFLPPLESSVAAAPSQQEGATVAGASDDDDDTRPAREPKRQRRMGIDEVLQ